MYLKKFDTLGKSLIKILKKRGPNIGPWGTPNQIFNFGEFMEFT